MEAKTSKEQMSNLLRNAQQLQAIAMGYDISVHIEVFAADSDNDVFFALTALVNHITVSHKTIATFREYEYNKAQFAEFKEVIMKHIEL